MGEDRKHKTAFAIFGLLIENKTDVLAFAAFLIAVTTAAAQLTSFLVGEELESLEPINVTVFDRFCDPRHPVEFIVERAFVNTAEAKYGNAVIGHQLRVKLAKDFTYIFENAFYVFRSWNNFTSRDDVDCRSLKAGTYMQLPRMNIEPQSDPAVFVVGGGSVATKQILFTASDYICDDGGRKCLSQVPLIRTADFTEYVHVNDEITLELHTILQNRTIVNTCVLFFQRLLEHFKEKKFVNVPCDQFSMTSSRARPLANPLGFASARAT